MNNQPQPSLLTRIPTSWWIGVLLVLGVFAVYWPVFAYGFIDYDDPDYVWQNPHVLAGLKWQGIAWAFTTFDASNWHPLTWLSLMLDTQVFGMHAGVYHAVNVLFHAANTVLLFGLLKRMTGALWRSAVVAALFGFHPLHVESVAWVAERKDVLSTFFFMLTLLAYARYAQSRTTPNPQPSALNYSLALLFFALGLMSKPMLVTLPFVLLLLDFWPLERVTREQWRAMGLWLEKIPFFALSAAACVVTVLAQKQGHALVPIDEVSFDGRLENTVVSYLLYLQKTVWPVSLAAFYPYPTIDDSTAAGAVLILLLISLVTFFFLRRAPYLATGWLWYLGTLVPVIGLVQVGIQGMADRYTYIPLIGIFIAVTWGVSDVLSGWRDHRPALVTASMAVLGACLTLTAVQVRSWQNSEILARHALAITTNNVPMEVLLANALLEQKKFAEAGDHFAIAVKISPTSAPVLSDLGFTLATEGKIDEAIVALRSSLNIKPNEVKPRYMLANLLSQQGDFAEAIGDYQTVLKIDPNYIMALNDLAWLLATAPDTRFRNGAQAVELAANACRLTDYKLPLFVGTLAAAYAEAGRFDDAVKAAEQAIALASAQGKKELVEKNRKLLELYRNHKAYHEPAIQR